jgi:formylglycine-generating enzyme required for sulfatase activity
MLSEIVTVKIDFFCCVLILSIISSSAHSEDQRTDMVLISAGEFQMGSNEYGYEDEKPIHAVYLDDFYIEKCEVTNAQYRKFVEATGHREPKGYMYANDRWLDDVKPWEDSNFNGDNHPVVCVSWEDAKAYCEWAGKRLPTEAEWEKAARGGLVGARYAWGDRWRNAHGNFNDETAGKTLRGIGFIKGYDDGYTYTSPVGSFNPNGYGLYDMIGNVWEWCADLYAKDYYGKSPKKNPKGPDSGGYGNHRVLRGGCWHFNTPERLRVAYRQYYPPMKSSALIGFRCVAQD